MIRTRARWAFTSFAVASRGVDFATFAAMMVALCAGLSGLRAYYDTR